MSLEDAAHAHTTVTETLLTASELAARTGVSRATAHRDVDRARREGRAQQKPVAIGNGATRLAWAIVVRTSTLEHT